MFPKLKELLSLVELSKMKVLAGHQGLLHEVKSVTIMDNPDIIYWMEENELLLTNGFFLKDYTATQMIQFIDELVKKKSAALFIKFKRFIVAFPKEVLDYAESIGFPIIEVPIELSWTDVSEPVNRYLNEKQFYFLHQAMNLRNDMLKLLLSGGTLDELCDLTAKSLDKELAIYDLKMKQIGTSKNFNHTLFSIAHRTKKTLHRYTLPLDELIKYEHYSIATPKKVFFLLPIHYEKDVWGYIILETSLSKPLIYADLSKTEQMAALAVVELSKINELKKIEKKYYTEFITHLVMGEIKTTEEIFQRGKQLGRTMYEKYIVCLLEHSKKHQLEEIVDSLRITFTPKTLVKECLYLEKDDHYLLLFPVIEEATASYSKLYDRLSKQGILSISKEHSILEIPSAYKEAKFAYSCQELMQNNQIFFEKTGILQLFFTSENELAYSFIRSYYDDLIQPLVDYDDLKNTELVKTLQMYINHDLNIYHTAQHLYIHENTLRSRIRRIESITSRDLQKMHDLFQVMLGLYLHKFYSRNPS
ncbi:PucR family transcriptional regulator [Listeria aquatica]|uniref:PucR family transcriptional regulator n=1 Tax=Listeria aquatica TaxID=1494960 RepID=UPI0031F523DD